MTDEAPSIVAATPPAKGAAPPRRARALIAALSAGALAAVSAALWYEREDLPSKGAVDAWVAPMRGAVELAADAANRLTHRDVPQVAAADAHSTSPIPPAEMPAAAPVRSSASVSQNAPAAAASVSQNAPARAVSGDARQDRAAPPLPTPGPSAAGAPIALAPSLPAPPQERAVAPSVRTQERTGARLPSYRVPMKPEKPSKSSRRTSGNATTAAVESGGGALPAPRPHAPWASLQPPSWVTSRAHSPGYPPGYKTAEHEVPVATPSFASKESAEPPAAAASAPAASASSAPSTAQLAAAAEPPALPARTAQPAMPAAVGADEERRAAALSPFDRSWFASRSAAPVEDRSVLPGRPAEPSPRASVQPSAPPPVDPPTGDRTAEGQRMLADAVPRVARQGELEVSRVLLIAASAYRPAQDKSLADAARLARIRDETVLSSRTSAPEEAQRLHGEARSALASSRSVRRALDLELRAFAADPRDPEIAGGLAALYLRSTPSQPERARQLALVALTARSPMFSTTRLEDWQTFAVASALSGHEADARNALFVTLALSANVERTCVSGWNALSNYGERMRGPVEALLYRVHMRGHSIDSPWCAWPPDWSTPPRLAGELH